MTNDKEFELEDERYYFENNVQKSKSIWYFLLVILVVISLYILKINWINLNEYNSIKSNEKYPVETVVKDQISYFGEDYKKFKANNGVNTVLTGEELEKYWSNCIGSCEIPGTDRFQYISQKQKFINWACNEREKEQHYSATKYAIWKLNKEGCVLTNLKEIKTKDKEEIAHLRWEKQKEMEIYLVILLIIFLGILHSIKKIIKNKNIK